MHLCKVAWTFSSAVFLFPFFFLKSETNIPKQSLLCEHSFVAIRKKPIYIYLSTNSQGFLREVPALLFFGCFVLCFLVNLMGIKLSIKRGTAANLDSTIWHKGPCMAVILWAVMIPQGDPVSFFHRGSSRNINSLGPTVMSQRLEKLARNNVAKRCKNV